MFKHSNFSTSLALLLGFTLIITIISPPAFALKIQLDYSLDDHGFFDPATQHGLKARRTLESVAGYFSDLLTDKFTGISSNDNNTFTAVFQHPSDTYFVEIPRITIPEDTLVIFVGARDLDASLLGYAGVGGYIAKGSANFLDTITSRGQYGITQGDDADDFAPWGGYLSFDLYANWYFDDDLNSNDVPAQQLDFYSNALHEFGHLLGIGTSDSWFRQTAYSYFDGDHTNKHYDDLVPLDETQEHWAQDVKNTLDNNAQPAALTPALKPGERKQFTKLDIAALEDVGWEINNSPEFLAQQTQLPSNKDRPYKTPDDINHDGHADLIWRNPTTGQMTITYLNWQQTDAGLHAETLEQVNWIKTDDTDWQLIAVEYLDADQYPDMVWWHQQSGEVVVWYMNKTEIKWMHSPFKNRPADSWKPISVVDFDNNGQADIVWWNQQRSQAEIWYVNQWGTENTRMAGYGLTLQSQQPDDRLVTSADFDGNGTADLVFVNKQSGNYTLWSLDQQTVIDVKALEWKLDVSTQLVAAKDYNGDGMPDLLLQADAPNNNQTTVLTLLTLKNLTTPKTQTDLRFAIPSRDMDSVN